MTWLPWILLGLAILWNAGSQRLNHRKRIHLEKYVVYLLLTYDVRVNHKSKFEQWICRGRVV